MARIYHNARRTSSFERNISFFQVDLFSYLKVEWAAFSVVLHYLLDLLLVALALTLTHCCWLCGLVLVLLGLCCWCWCVSCTKTHRAHVGAFCITKTFVKKTERFIAWTKKVVTSKRCKTQAQTFLKPEASPTSWFRSMPIAHPAISCFKGHERSMLWWSGIWNCIGST